MWQHGSARIQLSEEDDEVRAEPTCGSLVRRTCSKAKRMTKSEPSVHAAAWFGAHAKRVTKSEPSVPAAAWTGAHATKQRARQNPNRAFMRQPGSRELTYSTDGTGYTSSESSLLVLEATSVVIEKTDILKKWVCLHE